MGQKISRIGSKVLAGVGQVVRDVPGIVSASLAGGATGSGIGAGIGTAIEPGGGSALGASIGGLVGGVGAGLVKSIGTISDVIDAVKGNSQDVPLKPEHLVNVLTDGAEAVKSASNLKHLLPQSAQEKLETALQSASQGKIAQNIVKTGKFAATTADHVLGQVYKGKVKPDAAERVYSPVMQQARTMLSPLQQLELKSQRAIAHMASLNPVAPQAVAVEA